MKLTIEQARHLLAVIGDQRSYLRRLQERMKAAGVDDAQLEYDVAKAREALNALWVTLNYRTCRSGVGEPSTARRETVRRRRLDAGGARSSAARCRECGSPRTVRLHAASDSLQ